MFGLRKKTIRKMSKPFVVIPKLKRGKKTERPDFTKAISFFFDFGIKHDNKIFAVIAIIIVIGIIAVFSSTIVFADVFSQDKYSYLVSHIRFIAIGFVFMTLFYFIRIELLTKFWFIPFGISILLMLYLTFLTFTSQLESIDGATRWLRFGGFQFQPSEFVKISVVIFLAAFYKIIPKEYRNLSHYLKTNLLPFTISLGLILGPILYSRNLASVIVIGCIYIGTYAVMSFSKYQKYGFVLMVIIGLLFGSYFSFYDYRADRMMVWTTYLKTSDTAVPDSNGTLSRRGESFQFDQVLTALGSGGVLGVGLGNSVGKYYFVKTTAGDDSIIGIIGEEAGFVATAGIVLIYMYFVLLCFSTASKHKNNKIYMIIALGIGIWFGFQMFVHIGANIGVIPLTGQTLPLISLGGSSIISAMGAVGLILNVSKQPTSKPEEEPKRDIKPRIFY